MNFPYTEAFGQGSYPKYHGLWHLEKLGVVKELKAFESDAWTSATAAPAVRIALIDTSVDHTHPNLAGVINTSLMADFASVTRGRFVFRDTRDDQQSAIVGNRDTEPTDGTAPKGREKRGTLLGVNRT